MFILALFITNNYGQCSAVITPCVMLIQYEAAPSFYKKDNIALCKSFFCSLWAVCSFVLQLFVAQIIYFGVILFKNLTKR